MREKLLALILRQLLTLFVLNKRILKKLSSSEANSYGNKNRFKIENLGVIVDALLDTKGRIYELNFLNCKLPITFDYGP